MDHISKYTSNMNILTDRVNQKIIISFILGIVVEEIFLSLACVGKSN